jgi:hypothetical protein
VSCTGLSAFWCPIHGDCSCERDHDGDCSFDDDDCPLHSATSTHADTIDRAECEQRIVSLAADCGVTLTEHDNAIVTQFAQLLLERSRRAKGVTS